MQAMRQCGKYLLWAVVFCSTVATADLQLELTQGVDSAIPMAVLPWSAKDSTEGVKIVNVVRQDLAHSGQFRVLTRKDLAQPPTVAAMIDTAYWQQQDVYYALIGQLITSANHDRANIELVSLYSEKDQAGTKKPSNVLLTEQLRAPNTAWRALAHRVSDRVYAKLTGVRGVFSTKIAYVVSHWNQGRLEYELKVADADGFNAKTLLSSTQPIMSPAWSPDGKKMAYVSFESGDAAVYIQTIATGKRRRVSHYQGVNGAPAWSPDGKMLALVLTRTGSPKIYILRLDTGKLTQLTKGYSIDTEPAWAPDGKSLIFTSNRGGNPQIYRYKLADGKVSRLTFEGDYNAHASFLPNGQGIVMMHREDDLFGIATQNLMTGRLTVLARSRGDESPSVAPNGKMIIYATQRHGHGVLAMVSTNGRIKLLLPAPAGNVQEPAWSPFLTTSQH